MLRISHKIGRASNLLRPSVASSSSQIFLESSRTAQICKRQLRSQENQEELGTIKHAANGHSLHIPRVSSTFQTIHLSSSNGTGFRHQGQLFHSRQQMPFNTQLSCNIQRYLSNKSSSDGAGQNAKDNGLNTAPKKKRELFDNTMLALISVAIASGTFSIAPDAIEYMKKSKRDYSEVDPEDDVYLRMKEVSTEIKGEIIHHVLGKDISEMAESENKAAVNTADVVADVLHSEALQNAVVSLITRVIGSAQFQSACQTLLKNLWQDLINDPETLAQVVALLNTAIKDENIKKSFKELVLGILQDDEVYNELTGLVVRLGEDKEVLVATKELLTESAHQALNDPEILDHSMEFATDIVGDNVIQRTSGEALRNTVTYAVRPSLSSFLSSLGVILLLFSASALGKARMAARQSREMDVSVSMVIQNIGDSVLKTMWKVASIPSDTIVAVGVAIANVLLIPLRVSRDLVYNVQKMLGDAITTLHTTALKIIASPGKVVEGTRYIFKTTSQSMTQTMATVLEYISSLPGIMFFRMKEGIVFMACKVGSKSKSCAGTLYSMAETQIRHAMSRLSAIFSLGILQTSNSFSIMYANAVAWMKWQYFVINDKIEILLFTFIRSKLRPLFGND